MTVGQLLFDVEIWLRRYAIAQTIGRPELKLLFYEVFQEVYQHAIANNPEWFIKKAGFSGTSMALPADFYKIAAMVVDVHTIGNSSCTSGGVRIVDNDKWDSMQGNNRLKGTNADPIGKLEQSAITIAPTRTGDFYYYRNYKESDLSTESTDLATLLPIPYHQAIVLRMQEKARLRQKQIPDSMVGNQEQVMTMAKEAFKRLSKSLKNIKTVSDQTERPLTLIG